MHQSITSVLLVENDPADAGQIQDAIAKAKDSRFHIKWVTQLSAALEHMHQERFDVVLLDLALPDGQGVTMIDQVMQVAPHALVLGLSDKIDEAAIQHSAHEYFAKKHVDAYWMPRALNYLIERKIAKDAQRDSEGRFQAMSDASPLGIFVSDAQGLCIYTNAAYQKIAGLSNEQALGTNWSLAIHPEDRQRVLAEWHEAAHNITPFKTEYRFLRKDGSVVWTRVNGAAMGASAVCGHVQTIEDITERKLDEHRLLLAEEDLFNEKERAQVTLDSIGDAVLVTDLAGRVSYMNQVAEAITGWSRTDAMHRPLAEVFRLIDGVTRMTAVNPAQRAITEDKAVELAANAILIRRDGFESLIEDSSAPIHNRDGKVTGAVIVFHDVSESRTTARKMAHMAQHDFLTGLPNRMLLTERLGRAIGLAHRHHQQVALLFLDLDNFKQINDSLGHAIGDGLLQSVAKRLTECVRATDTVCRQGGDEFVILLSETEQPRGATLIAEKLLAAFVPPHSVGEHEIPVSISLGISVYPDDSTNLDAMMQNADTAMYHAKASGRNNYQFYKTNMNASPQRHGSGNDPVSDHRSV